MKLSCLNHESPPTHTHTPFSPEGTQKCNKCNNLNYRLHVLFKFTWYLFLEIWYITFELCSREHVKTHIILFQ